MKKALDAIDIMALIQELNSQLKDSKLINVYAINEMFLFKFRKKGEKLYMIFHPKIGLYLTSYEIPTPKYPSDFVLKLRKIIKNAKIVDVIQVNNDRIVRMEMREGDKVLYVYFEVIREGNLIVTDQNQKILFALKYKKMRDRNVHVGEKYKQPPAGLDPLKVHPRELYEKFKTESMKKLFILLLRTLNVPKDVLKEAFFKLNLSENVTLDAIDSKTFEELIVTLKNIIFEVKNGKLKPNLLIEDDNPIGVYPITYKHMKMGKQLIFYSSFNKAVDEYFTPRIITKLKPERDLKSKEKRISDIIHTIKKYETKEKKLISIANVIITNVNVLNDIIKSIRKRELDELRKLERTYGISILNVNYSKSEVLLKIGETEIVLDLKKTAGENAGKYFDEAKKLRKKIEKAEKILESLKRELEQAKAADKAEVIRLKMREKTRWYEKFRWFMTSDGFLVIGGKDSTQNEVLVRKYMEASDIFMHADIYGSPAVIIKSKKEKIPIRSILEAAQFTAVYSRAWEAGFSSVDVYWVRPEQVSKKAPSGEYISKGAFMIYGKRNYIEKVPLILAIGVKIKEDNVEIIYGPPSAVVNNVLFYVLLVPGNMKKEKTALQILKIFEKNILKFFKEKKVKFRLEIEKIKEALPQGSFHIIQKPEKVLDEIERYYREKSNEKTFND